MERTVNVVARIRNATYRFYPVRVKGERWKIGDAKTTRIHERPNYTDTEIMDLTVWLNDRDAGYRYRIPQDQLRG